MANQFGATLIFFNVGQKKKSRGGGKNTENYLYPIFPPFRPKFWERIIKKKIENNFWQIFSLFWSILSNFGFLHFSPPKRGGGVKIIFNLFSRQANLKIQKSKNSFRPIFLPFRPIWSKFDIFKKIFLLVGSIVAGMTCFSFLEGLDVARNNYSCKIVLFRWWRWWSWIFW